jgi:hypothetical protein
LIKDAFVLMSAMYLDTDLAKIVRTFAVDPARMAIAGRATTGLATATIGGFNPHVFNLVVVGTQQTGHPPPKAPGQQAEYLIAGGLLEDYAEFWDVRRLRELGYLVTHSFQFRKRAHTMEEYDFWGRWLRERWTYPDPAMRSPLPTMGEPPLLSANVLRQLTDVWTRFPREPDSIMTTARQALVREVLLPVGNERVSTLMVDMAALAAKYSSVAAVFRAAGVSPELHDAYRAALASARIYGNALRTGRLKYDVAADSVRALLGLSPASAVVRNFAFLEERPAAARALEDTGIWVTP